ncbi:transcriptional regulator [Mycolicibacterium moriokaense]|jgi:predicted transcriptional regulator|uniref:Transcriptional regulator BlaI n=1 Tax=Mycolicibacterium moriokaense TaxID=39691 RepID=A0AAD1HB35_9MYCO|nr:BlaI/MecI/CopY family transcriptional regulator [Mycolicibacterium moriokaense]MCV7041630.1 BlaI/MecI/CopY family transcriptional regulator [Mycolicibacterium moriokaense]ORB21936.1 transcriptional regulator [Mycolicibacterium moriokaense]BBX01586.1 transcriptional regulator BlaI [Mycolicibacterium moriokaense]
MAKWRLLGELERRVMEHLWSATEPQTVRQVHAVVSPPRALAYTTVMTVLRRLADKGLVAQHRGDRAHRYAAVHGRDELVAGLMVDVLHQVDDSRDRTSALVHFVESVGTDDLHALQQALVEVEKRVRSSPASAAEE